LLKSPDPEARQEERAKENSLPERHPGRIAFGIVVLGEQAMMLKVGGAIGVTALQQKPVPPIGAAWECGKAVRYHAIRG
jgi:hypothetical protein